MQVYKCTSSIIQYNPCKGLYIRAHSLPLYVVYVAQPDPLTSSTCSGRSRLRGRMPK